MRAAARCCLDSLLPRLAAASSSDASSLRRRSLNVSLADMFNVKRSDVIGPPLSAHLAAPVAMRQMDAALV
ncbi:uncharacterized protein V6R79_012177 [Siganus canaliculatus]